MKWILMAVAILLSWQAQAQRVYWKEHRDFAEMVINVLHPTEDNDLQPVKDSSAYLLEKAKIWQASKIPGGIKKDAVQKSLAELVKLCTDLHNAVMEKRKDFDIRLLAFKVHNKYHYIDGRQLIKN
ncbi:MAG: hypothetical protein KAX45_02585 [Chitinophagaceae bacterium]|nr:hypothetical protein [Chitinophagaceae bacterium]MBP6589137.1 hypothetical protein [Chitinophagaceae bacterium]MBP8243403.1 hypothetical protein [Chitinophagaceae bacterium]